MTDQDMQTLKELATRLGESPDRDDKCIAVVLFTLMGCIHSGNVDDFANFSTELSRQILG